MPNHLDHELVIGKNEFELSGINPQRVNLPARVRHLLKYLGPAFIVSVAYIDPGNFGTNIAGGSKFNYSLLWVILWSNLMAIFLQTLSAKLGIAAGQNLPQICARTFSKPVNWMLFTVAGVAAMATELAEILGAALGFYLLFGIPLTFAALLTGVATLFIVSLQRYGQQIVEVVIVCLVAVICAAYIVELFLAKPFWPDVAWHTLVPSLANGEALLVAVGMLGATVMPHVLYLHSDLVQHRNGWNDSREAARHLRLEKMDIIIAMNIAFLVNAAMVIVSAAVFYSSGTGCGTIEQAHHSLTPLLGPMSAGAFGIALLASGLSSSAVGTMAGQTITEGFVNLNIPLWLRRLMIILPGTAVICLGMNPMKVLIISQVVLSFALPGAVIPLLIVTGRPEIMGGLVNKKAARITGWVIAVIIIALNILLLFLTLIGRVEMT